MSAIRRFYSRILAIGAGTSMALVFGIIFVNALLRYTTGKSVEWGEELPIYLTIYGVMFGIGLAYLQDTHIRFTILIDLLPARLRERLFAAMDLVTCAVGVALAWSGVVFASRRGAVEASGLIGTAKRLATGTGLDALVWLGRMGTWQAAIAVGGIIVAVAALLRFLHRVQGA